MLIQDRTRKELWGLLFDVDRNCRYYEVIHARSTRYFFVLRILTLALLTGGVVSLLTLIPLPFSWDNIVVSSAFGAALAVLTVIDFATYLQRKAAIALSISPNPPKR